MDIVEKTQHFLSNWTKSGEADWYVNPCSTSLLSLLQTYSCHLHCFVNQLIFVSFSLSHKYLIQLHSTLTDSNAANALITAYHTLLSATLSLWLPKHSLALSLFSVFIKSMWQALPSLSQDVLSPAATTLGKLLINSMWLIDLQLDKAIADSKAAIAVQSETEEKEKEQVNSQLDELNAIQSCNMVTKDKGTLQELMRLLLVCQLFQMSFLLTGHSCRHCTKAPTVCTHGPLSMLKMKRLLPTTKTKTTA
jgi:hypothetical protein